MAIRKAFHGSMSSWLTQRKASDGYLPTLDALKADENVDWPCLLSSLAEQTALAGVVAVSANAWMLAFSVLNNILLTLLFNISSFSTFWTYALHTLLEGRHSAASNTLKKLADSSIQYREVFRRRRLRESHTELLQKAHFHTGSIFPTLVWPCWHLAPSSEAAS